MYLNKTVLATSASEKQETEENDVGKNKLITGRKNNVKSSKRRTKNAMEIIYTPVDLLIDCNCNVFEKFRKKIALMGQKISKEKEIEKLRVAGSLGIDFRNFTQAESTCL